MRAKITLSTAILFCVVIFTLQNTEVVSIRFLFWDFSLSRALLFFIVLAVGFLSGFFFGSFRKEGRQPDSADSASPGLPPTD